MSRIGKKIIVIPSGVSVDVLHGGAYGHQQVKVVGPKGELTVDIRKPVSVNVENQEVKLDNAAPGIKSAKSLHGLYRSLINNCVVGVTDGYEVNLEIVGTGYRAEQSADNVIFSIGYSHKITFVPPTGISVLASDQTQIKVSGVDKQLVGQTAAKIRSLRPPEPYKGKGIRYKNERILRKSVKNA